MLKDPEIKQEKNLKMSMIKIFINSQKPIQFRCKNNLKIV